MLALVFAPTVFAQNEIPKTIADSVGNMMRTMEGQLLGVAEAAGKFHDARSFGEQIKHVACSQQAFFNEIEGKAPPDSCERGGPRCFDYGNRILARINDDPLARVEGRYAGPNTRLGIAVTAVWHMTDHYGQLVEYLRMNGIVPPVTERYGLKVR
jgi:hypothetical protein